MLIARFVDSISANPTVRLDLNDGDLWRLQATSRFDPPKAKRARVSTLLTDGAHYPATAYDDRVLELRWLLAAATADVVAGELQKLARELDRPGNFLEYRPEGATHSVWFRTHRLGFDAVDTPTDGTHQWVEVNVPAEPFAYGQEETLSAVTVNNDPAAGSNGMFFDVGSPKGDVETPLFLKVAAGLIETSDRLMSAIAVRRRGTPSSAPFVLQCESMSMFTDTSLQANDPVMSGAASNYVRCTFATNAAMTGRAGTTHPADAGYDVRGTYRVFLRGRRNISTSDTVSVRLVAATTGTLYTGDTVVWPATLNRRWVDLGLVQFPLGADPDSHGYSGITLQTVGQFLQIDASRSAGGTSTLDMDVLLFVPADDRLCVVKWPVSAGAGSHFVLDSAAPSVYAVDNSGAVAPTQIAELAGGLPMISPGVVSRIYFLRDVSSSTILVDDKTSTMSITPYYWPRYLYVRPAAS